MTERQLALLRFMADFETQHHCPPTFEEMMRALKLGSKAGVAAVLRRLIAEGHVRQNVRAGARSYSVIPQLPAGRVCPACGRGG